MVSSISAFSSLNPVIAAVPLAPESLVGFITNSVLVAAIVTVGILLFTRMATRKMETIPGTKQNLVEFVVEFVLTELEGILGPKIARQMFPLLATIFVFILVSNWFGLLPGVGSIGYGEGEGITLNPEAHYTPYLRPATADLNMNLGIAAVFMLVWLYVSIKEVGLGGFLKHIFGAKGGMTGLLGLLMAVIFFIVGIIEVISIMFRPISLSLRLFGNIFAGETLLHTMAELGEKMGWPDALAFVGRVALPIPFYFMELLVGLVQAIVFTLLCAVYVQLSTAHDEEEHH